MCKHTDNIRSVFEQATPANIKEGCGWYRHARSLVFELSMAFGTTEEIVAGVIAALSQRTQWSTNIDRATRVLDGDNDPGGLPLAAEKAIRIRDGEAPEDVLGERAFKVQAFYRALIGDDDAAVIDTWMLDALDFYKVSKVTGERYQSYTKLQYERLADVVRSEAARVGMAITEYQATVWCIIRGRAE
jgi:hypothetical protein